jgi:rare lipoprotein A
MRSVVLLSVLFSLPFPALAQTQLMRMHASWYGKAFHTKTMASGDPFDMDDPNIAAHKSLPFGTRLKVTNPENGRTLVVTVKDRGPYVRGRDLDLSQAGADELGFRSRGTATLVVERVMDAH